MDDIKKRCQEVIRTVCGEAYKVKFGAEASTNGTIVNLPAPQVLVKTTGMTLEEAYDTCLTSAAHEAGHIAYTTFDSIPKVTMAINIVEDIRINREVAKVQTGFWGWQKSSVEATSKYLAAPEDIADLLSRKLRAVLMSAQGFDEFKGFAEWQDVCTLPDVQRAVAYLNGSSMQSTADAVEVAKKVVQILKTPTPFEDKPKDKKQSDDGENAPPKDEDEDNQSKGDEDSEAENAPDNSPKKDSDIDDGDEDSDDASTGVEYSDTDVEDSNVSIDDSDDTEPSTSLLKKSIQKMIDMKSEQVEATDKSKDMDWDALYQDAMSRERRLGTPTVSLEENKKLHEKYFKGTSHEGLPIVQLDNNRHIDHVRPDLVRNYSTAYVKALIEALTNALSEKSIYADPAESGRFDKRRMVNYRTRTNIFNAADDEVQEWAVYMHLDASGSMSGIKARDSLLFAWHLGDALYEMGIPFRCVSAYCATGYECISVLKEWNEPIKINRYECNNSNRDGAYIAIGGVELQERKETNKILISLSDGMPAGHQPMLRHSPYATKNTFENKYPASTYTNSQPAVVADMSETIRNIRNKGIKVLGAYLELDSPSLGRPLYGSDMVSANDGADLGRKILKYLTTQFSA